MTITRGGGEIPDILPMLEDNKDELPISEYGRIKSITVCVGTNDLSDLQLPLLRVMTEYDRLINQLLIIFPNALVMLYNIPPRICHRFNHIVRIKSFNNFMYDLEVSNRRVQLINVFREFLYPSGFINLEFYNRDGLHMNEAGKKMMIDYIYFYQTEPCGYRPFMYNH